MGSFEDRKVPGWVFNIQKYSVHDGPGIRTVVFTKGCPLSCRWCSNPESQDLKPNMAYNEGRCATLPKCTRCVEACPQQAISRDETGIHIKRELCQGCQSMACAEACPSKGMIVYGELKTVDEVLNTVEQDAIFYSRSGGGMTISGGEPLMQKEFALALLREAKVRRIKSAIETSGCVPWETLEQALPLLNTMLFDFKHMDPIKHQEWTGVDNKLIQENFKRAVEAFPKLPILVRTPVIPGFNDDEASIRAIAEAIAPYPNVSYELLPYHRLGTQKYTFLGRTCDMGDITLPHDITPRLQKMADEIIATARQS